MKVLFVISSLNTGGAQRALSNVVCGLADDWEIDILINGSDNITYPYRGNLIDLGIREPASRKNLLYQLRVLIKRFTVIRKLKKQRSYNACVSFLESANIANVLTGRKHCKTIVSVRNYLHRNKSPMSKYMRSVLRFFYNRADSVVALSKGVENDLALRFGLRQELLTTIYNGFPLKEIRDKAGERGDSRDIDGEFTFITIGRCEQQKGQWHLLRAFARLAREHGNTRLVILGSGPYAAYLNALINAYGLDDRVSLKGFVENPYKELINADVFVFPSLWEGFGNAMLEAMTCALPVVASDYRYGAREILAPDTDIEFEQVSEVELAEFGIITPVCSGTRHAPEEPLEPQEHLLLEAMELMCSDEGIRQRYCLASEKRAAEFAIDKCVTEWQQLIEGAIRY